MPDAAEQPPPPLDLTGRTLGDFQILRKLGQGGMGTVYLARQLSLKREVALKFLKKELTENATALQRFQAEAEAVARISHPNIVQVYSLGEEDGLRYMALEYVEGRNLREYLERKGALEVPLALAIFRQIAAALQRAGELGLVHRDIKPENILLTRKVEVKVTDFGLSRYFAGEGKPLSLTQSGMTLGTPLYMSPEQVQGKAVDHRSDLYSFGVTAYHALSGRAPFKGANAFEVAVQHVQAKPEPLEQLRPDLPDDLVALVNKLMAKKAADRYATAKEVLRDLARIQKGAPTEGAVPAMASQSVPVPVSPSGPVSSATTTGLHPIPQRSRWPWRLLGLVGGALLPAIGWFAYGLLHPAQDGPVAPPIIGLPGAKSPTAIVASAETDWKDKLRKAPAPANLKAGLQLGAYYLQERRFDEADALFQEIEALKLPAPLPWLPVVAGRLGRGATLAWKDQPAESVKLLEEGTARIPVPLYHKHLEPFFFDNTEFAQAVAEAVNRNAENLAAAGQKLPAKLEWLRTPSGMIGGPK